MSGQLLANGIDRGIAQIGDAIRRSQEERKKKEQEKQAKEAVMKAGQALYGAEFDLKDAPQEAWGQIVQLAEAKRNEPMRALQMETQKLANENALLNRALTALHIKQGADAISAADKSRAQEDRNRAAVSGAFGPETVAVDASEPFSGTAQPTAEQIYRRAALSGADVATLDRLAASLRATRSDELKAVPGSAGFGRIEVPDLGTLVIDKATGQPIDGGKVIRPHEKKSDEKALTATEIQQIQALQQAGRDLSSLSAAYGEIGDKDWGGPVAGRIKALDPTNPNISRISNLVTAATPNLARGVFREVGVLTDEDIKRYRKLLPDYTDTAAQRTQKLADLQKRLAEQTDETLRTLQAAGRDVSGLKEKILGDRAQDSTPGGASGQIKGPDGQMHPIVTVRGRRGIVTGGKFYPIVE